MARPPIFILAPQPRSGTNYLWELLRRHPECIAGRAPIWEDYLLLHAQHLFRFVEAAQASWDHAWGPTEHLKPELLRHLGDGITRFLAPGTQHRVVTKSPTVGNIDLFFEVFPDADLLLLLRDGRDVVASGMATFGWTFEDGARSWAWSVDRVMRFVDANAHRRVRIVRFEELVENLESVLRELLQWLGLDPDLYPYAALGELPVRGSSRYRGSATHAVNWQPLPRPKDFRPIARWASWTHEEIDRFHDIAGSALETLGYSGPGSTSPSASA